MVVPRRLLLASVAVSLASAVALAAPSAGRSVFLNEHNIDSVRAQTFEKVDVQIDADGNVHIKSDAYKIEGPGAPSTPKEPEKNADIPRGTRYWLISEENAPGMSQYDLDIVLNGTLIKTVKSGEPQVVEDVTKFVIPGTNFVNITARKSFGSARKSESKDLYLRVYVGRGALNDAGAIIIENPEIDYRKTAADIQNFADQLKFVPK